MCGECDYRLDKWLRQCDIAPSDVDFVKCDAQGAEGHVFSGARKLLTRRRALFQVEYWPRGLQALGTEEIEFQGGIRTWFTHFAVLRKTPTEPSPTVRPVTELESAIADLDLGERGFANLLLFPSAPKT